MEGSNRTMKTKTITVREGELLGLVDWDFDFKEFYKDIYNCGTPEQHEKMFQRSLTILKLLEQNPDKYEATTYGGWPRCGWGSILHVGMYDGWPYWKPVPSVCIQSWTGMGEWCTFHNISDIRIKGEEWPLKI